MKKFIINSCIMFFITFTYCEEISDKKESEIMAISPNTVSNPDSTNDSSFLQAGKSTMKFLLKNWIKIACPTVGLSVGIAAGAHMTDDYGTAAIIGSAVVGITAGYIAGKKITNR